VSLAGGPNANFVLIPTAQPDSDIDPDKMRQIFSRGFGVTHVTVLNTRDRARANSEGFVEPLRHASGLWIDGGRQWRLADAYLGTAVEREIKALVARGGVVGGGSAGATIQGSYLVRGSPQGNEIMMSPGHEVGFGLLANSAIDQHVDARGREKDLDQVVSAHPELLGIGVDQGAAIVVHGNLFSVMDGQVAIHDGKNHDGARYYFLSPGQTFDLKARSLGSARLMSTPASVGAGSDGGKYPLTLTVISAQRQSHKGEISTNGTGLLTWNGDPSKPAQRITFECDTGVFSRAGSNVYPARSIKPYQIKIESREMGSDKVHEATCKY
jgi:cyanophycinase